MAPFPVLGTFHPVAAERVIALLDDRGIPHLEEVLGEEVLGEVVRGRAVRVRIEASWHEDVLAELALTWADLLASSDPDRLSELWAAGSPTPGWYDAPRGGHVDRGGKLVVDRQDDDEFRRIGPAAVLTGALLLILGWFVLDSGGTTSLGLALVVFGVLVPR